VPVFYSMPVFYGTPVCQYKFFLLDINTGTNIVPSYRYYTGILPSSITQVFLILLHASLVIAISQFIDSTACTVHVSFVPLFRTMLI